MRQAFHDFAIETRGKGLYEITRDVRDWLKRASENGTKPVKSAFSLAMLQWRHPPYTM